MELTVTEKLHPKQFTTFEELVLRMHYEQEALGLGPTDRVH